MEKVETFIDQKVFCMYHPYGGGRENDIEMKITVSMNVS